MSSPLNPKGEILDVLAFSITPVLKAVCCTSRYRQIGQPYCCATCDVSVIGPLQQYRYLTIRSPREDTTALPLIRDFHFCGIYGPPTASLVCRRPALRATWLFFLRKKEKSVKAADTYYLCAISVRFGNVARYSSNGQVMATHSVEQKEF